MKHIEAIVKWSIEKQEPVCFVVKSLPFTFHMKDKDGNPYKISKENNPLDMNCLVGIPHAMEDDWIIFKEPSEDKNRVYYLDASEIVMMTYLND